MKLLIEPAHPTDMPLDPSILVSWLMSSVTLLLAGAARSAVLAHKTDNGSYSVTVCFEKRPISRRGKALVIQVSVQALNEHEYRACHPEKRGAGLQATARYALDDTSQETVVYALQRAAALALEYRTKLRQTYGLHDE